MTNEQIIKKLHQAYQDLGSALEWFGEGGVNGTLNALKDDPRYIDYASTATVIGESIRHLRMNLYSAAGALQS